MRNLEANDLINSVKEALGSDAITKTCSRDGCDVSTGGLSKQIVIADVDAPSLGSQFTGKRPDFILFIADRRRRPIQLVGVPLELKSGGIDVDRVAGQLRAGASYLEDLEGIKPPVARCLPILVYGGRVSRRQSRLLNREKVMFRRKKLTILRCQCGRRRNLLNAIKGR